MTSAWIAFGAAVLVAMLCIVVVFRASKKRALNAKAGKKIKEVWILTQQIADLEKRILEADKVLDTALGLLGYKGSLGDKLKNAGPRFSDSNAVWDAHKLRNKIAHELGHDLSEKDANRAMRAFERALHDLGMQ